MKTRLCLAVLLLAFAGMIVFDQPVAQAQSCTTIQSGLLRASDNTPIELGFDKWGYNYQANAFNGKYCDAYRNAAWCQPYVNDDLAMKWNDAWLSKSDCNGDNLLDRHVGYPNYRGSGAWLTNHQKGSYIDVDGKKQRWEYFTKIVAAPLDAVLSNGMWYMHDSKGALVEIGYEIWGEFAVVQEIQNDTGTGQHGVFYHSPKSSGLGFYGPQ